MRSSGPARPRPSWTPARPSWRRRSARCSRSARSRTSSSRRDRVRARPPRPSARTWRLSWRGPASRRVRAGWAAPGVGRTRPRGGPRPPQAPAHLRAPSSYECPSYARFMNSVRIVTIVGNRPQFVKAAAVSRLLRARHEELLVHTGQHYDDELSKVFFEELGIPPPDRELGAGSGSNTEQTARILAALAPVLAELRPGLALVYGDTNSTLAGAVAAAQADIPVGHVEAGMRSFDRSMPEELNRVLTDHASDLLLCSTQTAMDNLAREGVQGEAHLVGDVMADVSLAFREIAAERSAILADLGLAPGAYLVVTAHRAGNVDDPARLERLVALLEALPNPVV